MTYSKSIKISGLLLSSALVSLCAIPAFGSELKGVVTNGVAQNPLPGAKVTIEQTKQSVVTNSDGSFRIPNLPNGSYTLLIEYVGTPTQSRSVNVNDRTDTQFFRINETLDEIVAVGQRANMLNALNRQRNADNLVSVVSSDAIGQFPDQNVTEAARRVPGISVENDQGEGRYIVIRGVDPSLNTTSINGTRIPSPEGDIRATALDVIDSEVLESIEITKSLTPDMDGDGIGGNIEIKTISAFDRKGRYLKGKLAGSYNEQTSQWAPKISVAASDIFADGNLGIALTGSYRQRKFGSENYEVDGGWGDGFPEEMELRDYQITRERINLAGNIDYKLGDTTKLYLRTLYSDFTDEEFRLRRETKLKAKDLKDQNGDILVFKKGRTDRDTKDRVESQKIWSATLGGLTELENWTLDYSAAISHAEEKEPNRLDVDYRTKGKGVTLDISDRLRPVISLDDATYSDPSKFAFDKAENLDGFTEDDETAFAFNIRRNMVFGNDPGFIKVGAKIRQREKSRNVDVAVYDGNDAFSLADVQGSVDYSPFDMGPVADQNAVRSFFNANRSTLDIKADDTFIGSNVADFNANEDISAAYVMTGIDILDLSLRGGLRIEHTNYDGRGRDVRLFVKDATLALDDVPAGAECRDADGNAITPVAGTLEDDLICIADAVNSDSYTDALPSIVAKLDATDNLVLRASFYKSVARPSFKAVVPSAEIEQDDANEFKGVFGNVTALGIPRLKHQSANSFDIGGEYYTDNGGVISLGIFHKSFTDFIAKRKVRDFPTTFANFNEAVYYVNLSGANLTGVEFNFQQSLNFLDGPFSGLLVGANYTYIDGEAKDLEGRAIALPKQSENIANLVLGYEGYNLDLRLAWAYRGEYLDEVDGRSVAAHDQLDFTAKYKINDNFGIFGEISNITDEPFLAYEKNGGRQELSQYEEYGRTFEIGLRYKY